MRALRLRAIAAAGAAAAALLVGGLVANETLLSENCSATIAVGASWDTAYKAASPGDTLCVADGQHPGQTLRRDPAKTAATSRVIFKGSRLAVVAGFASGISGGSVTTATGAQHFELAGITVTGEVALKWGSDDVIVRDVDAGNIRIQSSTGVQVLGGDYGPFVNQVATINNGGTGSPGVRDILIDGAYFHDYTISDAAKHAECMQIWPTAASSNITIRNSHFRNCTDFGVLVKAPALTGMVFDRVTLDKPMPGNVATVTCNPNCPRAGSSIRFSTHQYPGGKVLDSKLGGSLAIDQAGFVEVVNTCMNCDPGAVPTTTTEPPPTTTEPTMPTFADDFERASLGTTWTKHFGDVGIIGGSLGLLGPSAFGLLSYNASLPADQFSEAVVAAGVSLEVNKGVFVRRRASDGARYQLHYDGNGTDADPRPQWQLKYDGVPTAQARVLAAEFATPEPAGSYEIHIEVQGSEIRGYLNDQLLLSATDSAIPSGSAGVALLKVGGVTAPTPIFDSWAGGDLVAIPAPADSLPLTIVSQDATSVTVGWTPPAGVSWYLLYSDGVRVANASPTLANGSLRTSAKFQKKPGAALRVEALASGSSGSLISP